MSREKKSEYVNICYRLSLNSLQQRDYNCWVKFIRDTLEINGFGDVWLNQGVADIDIFMHCLKDRLKCTFWQDWHGRLENSTRAIFYRSIRQVPQYQSYLEIVTVKAHRQALTRLLTSSHALRVETGRWDRPITPRDRRICNVCNKTEDEYHFLIECHIYKSLRKKLLPQNLYIRPSMFKLSEYTCNERQIRGLAKFTYCAFQLTDSYFEHQ